MTEEEAKTKTCHKTLAAVSHNGALVYSPAACVGSACMAWRRAAPIVSYGSYEIGENANPAAFKPTGDGWSLYSGRWQKETLTGYCGLAGKPG
jgi:hypothetical protein